MVGVLIVFAVVNLIWGAILLATILALSNKPLRSIFKPMGMSSAESEIDEARPEDLMKAFQDQVKQAQKEDKEVPIPRDVIDGEADIENAQVE